MRVKSKTGQKTFALSADVSEAHRQVPIAESEWYLQIQPASTVYVKKVGTFGVASARYRWSRVASATGRLAQYLVGDASHTWHMLVADDFFFWKPAGRATGLPQSFSSCCAPPSTCPCRGTRQQEEDTVTWVGFELLLHSNQLGISERQAEWLTRWSREVADPTYVQMGRFEEGLGRIVYVAGALEFERPFLGPLYKFLTIHPGLSSSSAVLRGIHREVLFPPPQALPLCVRIGLI